ncbi:CRISPR-associated protein Cas5 [Halothermothrix orenii]|uniref:CRISPR-associated protein Cas5 n=1 Tax=Halothermothrix orenii (strain H 168 / OCM 544 / DSM 9562) TaxID=373903 RepID=B8CYA3_HALOH|nr:CRISPR-associated protein Cas5 [Halothermothrix orenii]ACL70272.1 CRISPR-associated protein Cas5 [Halothermothrix orenii H 168]
MDINQVLVFKIKGKIAHFKKYYSNKSSLTYKIPPRTVLMGIVASILEKPRDSYYELLSPQQAKFGVKIESESYTHFECMNYLKEDGGHTQVRLQLLLPANNMLSYKVFFTHQDESLLKELATKIKNKIYGYGIYLGQRQFRATAEFDDLIEDIDIIKDYTGNLKTLTYKDNIKKLNDTTTYNLILDNMPVSFKKVNSGREPEKVVEVCYEENGANINGSFYEVIKLKDDYISFYTPVR